MAPLLEVRHLKKYYPVHKGPFQKEKEYVHAVDDVSFQIEKNEVFGLVGESGCGKTTVGRLIVRLIEATDGEILFDGQDFRALGKKELREMRRNVQVIFQDPYGSLNPRMTVRDIIAEPLYKHHICPRTEVDAQVKKLLSVVGLSAKEMSKYPHEFSGGQRQRIVIARALSVQPKLIVCDEPVSALDVSVQAQILNLMDDIQKEYGTSYLFIAHGIPVVQHISSRIAVMYMGKLVEIAPSENFFLNSLHPYTKALVSAVPIPDPELRREIQPITGELPSLIHVPAGCRFHTRCPYADARCRTEEPPLVEVQPGHFCACHHASHE